MFPIYSPPKPPKTWFQKMNDYLVNLTMTQPPPTNTQINNPQLYETIEEGQTIFYQFAFGLINPHTGYREKKDCSIITRKETSYAYASYASYAL